MLSISLLLFIIPSFSAFRQQSVGVSGRLICGNQPLSNTQLKLWDKNFLGKDNQLAEVFTDSNGNFNISGGIASLMKLDVHLKIYHNCDNSLHPCKRKVDLSIPQDYIRRSETVDKWFNAGTLNMAFKFPDEDRDCF